MTSRKSTDDPNTDKNPFELPRSISKALKRCVSSHGPDETGRRESIKYLWLYLSADSRPGQSNGKQNELGEDEWLNVLDEAASLGVQCVLACVSTPLTDYPKVLSLCQWAQETHNMRVGIFVYKGNLNDADLEFLGELDHSTTCIFLRADSGDDADLVTKHGLGVCSGSVTPEDHTPPCDLPEDMLCVGPDGNLYTCGLVLGNDKFKLGNALSTPLRQVVDDDALPHTVPHDAPYQVHGCDACPPIMAKRVMEFGQQDTAP